MKATFQLDVENEAEAAAIFAMLQEYQSQGVPLATTEDGAEVHIHNPTNGRCAASLMHDAWELAVVFLAPTLEEAHAKAEAHAEAQMLEFYEPGDGGLDEGDTEADRAAWVATCWEQGAWTIDGANLE